MTSLYEMTAQWQQIYEMLLDPEVPEDAVLDTLEGLEGVMDQKADNYGKLIRSLEENAAAVDDELRRLTERKRSLQNRAAVLRKNLEAMMRATGRHKIQTPLFTISIQKNGGAAPLELDSTMEVPAQWRKPGEPDTAAIRKYLTDGGVLPFARLGQRGESLRIR